MEDPHTPHPGSLPDSPSEPGTEPREEPPRRPIELQPRLRVARLNRLVLAVIGIGAILILWTALWVLGRKPRSAEPLDAPRSASRPVDLDRLERGATRKPTPTSPRPGGRSPLPPPPSIRRPARAATQADPEALRAQRALDANPVVSAFQNASLYPQGRASGFRAALGGNTDAEASAAEPARSPKPPDRLASVAPAGRTLPTDDTYVQPLEPHEAFLEAAQRRQRLTTLPAELGPVSSPFTLYEGTYLPAILTAGIHSDLPGQTTALVRENVYDSRTGRHLLVPSGSRLLGAYDHRVAWGERRVLLAWHRLIFPDGTSLDLRGLPGADLAGEAGVRDRVDNHFVRTFGTALLLSAFSAGAQLSQPQEATGLGQAPSARQVVAAALGQEINRLATELLRRDLNRQPTLEIRPGKLFFVQLTADLVLPHAYASPQPPARPG